MKTTSPRLIALPPARINRLSDATRRRVLGGGFTLVELLVVIAIISILTALL